MIRPVRVSLGLTILICILCVSATAEPPQGEGWKPLFNGRDLAGWKLGGGRPESEITPQSDWHVVDGVIDYNAKDGKNLWTEKSYGDFVLHAEWRLKTAKELYGKETDAQGKPITHSPDSGLYLRGVAKCQTNIWLDQMGSGEIWGCRVDKNLPQDVRDQRYRPSQRADKPQGQWNTFEITLKGQHITVVLNGVKVIDAPLPDDIPATGPIALQHHGRFDAATKTWSAASATVQFRDLYIKELAP